MLMHLKIPWEIQFPEAKHFFQLCILFVFGTGLIGIFAPGKWNIYKDVVGILKTAEIAMESAIQTCLGKSL